MSKTTSEPRRRLLDASLKLFANRGYAGTSVQEIIDEAKVTKPTLYYYFENKEGLFQALVDQAMDERLRLMSEAAPDTKPTVDQLTDIIVAVTDFTRRHPDLLRLCFSIAFAAPGEFPSGFKKPHKMHETLQFVRQIIKTGLERGALNSDFTIDELTQAYFNIIQHATVMAVFEAKLQKSKLPGNLPPRMAPRRMIELFLRGSAIDRKLPAADAALRRTSRLAKAAAILALFGLPLMAFAQTNAAPVPAVTNEPVSAIAPTAIPTPTPAVLTNAADMNLVPMVTIPEQTNTAPSTPSPNLADVRPEPLAVQASHPELATVSPIAKNSCDTHALDLQTCFQLTAVRNDSLKISLQDIYVAQAQLSQAIAALWPTFTATNQQQFLHYRSPGVNSFNVLGNSTFVGNRNYTSQSHVTMNYTLFNGGQNWNTVGANEEAIEAKRQTLARNYQTIYQSVAQAFYDVLQYEGDMIIQSDLIDALKARVDDLHDRVNLGRSRPAELLQAQTDLANAKVTYEQQRGSLNAAKETLAFYIGIPSSYIKLKDTQRLPSAAQLEAYLKKSGTRPDILSQLDSLREAERNLSVAKGQLWPTITATGDYLASQDPPSNQIDASMTLEASMPIFDGGLIIAQIHQNKELVRQSALNVEQLQRTADQDTRTAYANFNASIAQVLVLHEAAELAARNFEAQVDDYRRGVVSNLDVLTALQDYQAARQQLHDVNMQARLNLINLHVAAGTAATGPNANNQALPTATTTTTTTTGTAN
ncbi:MAG: TolC family protein [Methylacidiphilales bacterium]|nr:TolC family protein [Candidatus Methylacidiphilales bacterium]